jgi:hypothetical protein
MIRDISYSVADWGTQERAKLTMSPSASEVRLFREKTVFPAAPD